MKAARIAGLYAVTPDLDDTDLLAQLVEAAIDGGATVVQYRHKTASASLRRLQGARLARVCRAHGVPLIVNDHLDDALALDGAGLHVGIDDHDDVDDLDRLRTALGPTRLFGVSCYADPARARRAAAAGADYVAFGSVFPSSTKKEARPAPLSLFSDAPEGIATVGIGGIDAGNLPRLIEAGADAAAVIGALFQSMTAGTVRQQATALARLFTASTIHP